MLAGNGDWWRQMKSVIGDDDQWRPVKRVTMNGEDRWNRWRWTLKTGETDRWRLVKAGANGESDRGRRWKWRVRIGETGDGETVKVIGEDGENDEWEPVKLTGEDWWRPVQTVKVTGEDGENDEWEPVKPVTVYHRCTRIIYKINFNKIKYYLDISKCCWKSWISFVFDSYIFLLIWDTIWSYEVVYYCKFTWCVP